MPKARVRPGRRLPSQGERVRYQTIRHGMIHPDYDPKHPSGRPGPKAQTGEVIEVTEQELRDFPDKLERVPDDTPLTYADQVTDADVREALADEPGTGYSVMLERPELEPVKPAPKRARGRPRKPKVTPPPAEEAATDGDA